MTDFDKPIRLRLINRALNYSDSSSNTNSVKFVRLNNITIAILNSVCNGITCTYFPGEITSINDTNNNKFLKIDLHT